MENCNSRKLRNRFFYSKTLPCPKKSKGGLTSKWNRTFNKNIRDNKSVPFLILK